MLLTGHAGRPRAPCLFSRRPSHEVVRDSALHQRPDFGEHRLVLWMNLIRLQRILTLEQHHNHNVKRLVYISTGRREDRAGLHPHHAGDGLEPAARGNDTLRGVLVARLFKPEDNDVFNSEVRDATTPVRRSGPTPEPGGGNRDEH